MSLNRDDRTVRDTLGRAVPNATVYWVTQPATTNVVPPSPLVAVATTASGTASVANNPQVTNGFGQVAAYMATGTYTVVFVWNGIIQQVYPDQFVGIVNNSVVIATNQVAFATGTNAIGGSANLTWNDTTKFFNLSGANGSLLQLGSAGDWSQIGGLISTAFSLHAGVNVGVSSKLYTLSMDPGSTGTGGLTIAHNLGTGPAYVWDAATGYMFLRSASNGFAGIGVSTGTPNVILLPTATATAGGLLVSDGANPQQSSWTSNLTYADETLTITQTDTLDTPLVVNLTTTVPGTLDPAITFNDVALAHPFSINRGDSIPFNITGWYIGNAGFNGSSYIALSDDSSAIYFSAPITGLNAIPQSTSASIIVKGSGSQPKASIQFTGFTSGTATIQIAAIAGNTAPIQLPTTNSAANQTLISDGNNPQQLSWGGISLLGATHTPSSAADTGTTGTIAWDSSFIYICVATNTWKRVAIATW